MDESFLLGASLQDFLYSNPPVKAKLACYLVNKIKSLFLLSGTSGKKSLDGKGSFVINGGNQFPFFSHTIFFFLLDTNFFKEPEQGMLAIFQVQIQVKRLHAHFSQRVNHGAILLGECADWCSSIRRCTRLALERSAQVPSAVDSFLPFINLLFMSISFYSLCWFLTTFGL